MRRYPIVLAFALLAAVPALVFATVSYRALEPEPFGAGLALIALAGVASALLGGQLLRRGDALQAEIAEERRRKAQFEMHSREMYRELERKLEERTAELLRERDIVVRTEKLTSLGRLVGGVAHELNNPLMAILGEATMLRQRCDAPELSRGLRVIEQQASRCASLIRDLIAFASLEQRKVQVLDLHALLEGALAQAAMVAPRLRVEVVRYYWHNPLVVAGNMEQLQQALVNVIGNAHQAMARNESGQLTLRSRRKEGGRIQLEVSDTGVGIEPAALPYIFDPFYSRPLAEEGPGVGLGLSVALGLIEAHEGNIWVESEVGRGTTVFIELPEADVGLAAQGERSAVA